MRNLRIIPAATMALLAASLLVGCSADKDAEQSSEQSAAQSDPGAPTVNRNPTIALPEVSGEFGEAPTITTISDAPPSEIIATVIGTDSTLAAQDITVEPGETVTVNYQGVLWSDGTEFDSSFSRGEPATFGLNEVIPAWTYGLQGTKVGDRVLIIAPPEFAYGSAERDPIPANSTLIFVVDVLGVDRPDLSVLDDAKPTDKALPEGVEITGDLGAEPTIAFSKDAKEPTEETVIVLAEGSGAPLVEGQTVTVHLTAGQWGAADSVQSTWPSGVVRDVVPAFLKDIPVGSRVLWVAPDPSGEAAPAQTMVIDIVDSK